MTRLAEKTLQKTPVAVAVVSNEVTIVPETSRYFVVDVDANVTTVTITEPPGACDFIILFQFAGSYTVGGFSADVKWIGTNLPDFSGASGEEVIVVVSYFNSTVDYRADSGGVYTPTAES